MRITTRGQLASQEGGGSLASPGTRLLTVEGQWEVGSMCTEGLEAAQTTGWGSLLSGCPGAVFKVPPGSGLALQEGGPVVLALG